MPPANKKTVLDEVMDSIGQIQAPIRARMLARLLENQALDTWMTYELMEAAIKWVAEKKPIGIQLELNNPAMIMTRDQASSTTADELGLFGKAVDSFYNFQSIRVAGGGAPAMRHQQRPDGMFSFQVRRPAGGNKNMVLFYEGDVHGKDDGKTLTSGCKNSHKMYQAIAQAQSKCDSLAGCAIFAAMQYAPTDELLIFLDDMLKAHIFVCIAIADWNTHATKKRQGRSDTLMSGLFDEALAHNLQYDFVVGINVGLHEGGVPGFNRVEYDHRITTMLASMGINGNIEIAGRLQRVAQFHQFQKDIGCVKIAICAIPRAKKDILKRTAAGRMLQTPTFIYPLHIQELVHWHGDIQTVQSTEFSDHLTFVGATIKNSYSFYKHMMHMVVVHINAVATPDKNTCNLSATDGFFYVALPFAYYTIQQFEFVNAVLNYLWSPTRFDFRAMLRKFKANKQKLTGDLKVSMFVEDQGSLFQVICKSVNKLPKIENDFKLFLKHCCRWRDIDSKPTHASPTIFFRTLGIFSLQNAIDFACDMRTTPNKSYDSLLASYPVGAQLLIQQSLKKLTGNEAYAYIGREEEAAKTNANPTDEQPDSDDESANTPTFSTRFLEMERALRTRLYHSSWAVKFEQKPDKPKADKKDQNVANATTDPDPTRQLQLATQLMKAYADTVEQWVFTFVEFTNTDGEMARERLSKILTKNVTPIQLCRGEIQIYCKVPQDLFTKDVNYRIKCVPEGKLYERDYLCTPIFPEELQFSTHEANVDDKDIGFECKASWEPFDVTFKLTSRSVQQAFMQQASQTYAGIIDSLKKTLMTSGTVNQSEWEALMTNMISAQENLSRAEANRQQRAARPGRHVDPRAQQLADSFI
jgi:hypothetical protein